MSLVMEPCFVFSWCRSEPDGICTGVCLSELVSSGTTDCSHSAQPWPVAAFHLLYLSTCQLAQVLLNGDLDTAEHYDSQSEPAKEVQTQSQWLLGGSPDSHWEHSYIYP